MPNLDLAKTQRIEVRASSAAHQARAERRHFSLSDAQWNEFQQAFERPVQTKLRLQNRLSKPEVLD